MALLEGKTPAERKKTIAALVLGGVALLSLTYMLFGSSSTPPKRTTSNTNSSRAVASATPRPSLTAPLAPADDPTIFLKPVVFTGPAPSIPEAGRNIFAFYVAPPKNANTAAATPAPTEAPTPTPVPPNVLVVSVSPANVYARTGDFTLEVTGDKFTPAVRIQLNGTDVPTRFISPQQLSANISASLISFEGARQISVRSPDGQLFSNAATLNVQAPPVPNYVFVGLLAKRSYNDTALLKDKSSRDLLSVQRGDMLGGRFRVTSISEREVAVLDANLKIKHSLPYTADSAGGTPGSSATPSTGFPNPNQRYTPPPQGDDDEEP